MQNNFCFDMGSFSTGLILIDRLGLKKPAFRFHAGFDLFHQNSERVTPVGTHERYLYNGFSLFHFIIHS